MDDSRVSFDINCHEFSVSGYVGPPKGAAEISAFLGIVIQILTSINKEISMFPVAIRKFHCLKKRA